MPLSNPIRLIGLNELLIKTNGYHDDVQKTGTGEAFQMLFDLTKICMQFQCIMANTLMSIAIDVHNLSGHLVPKEDV